jgi:predicted DNA binding protein
MIIARFRIVLPEQMWVAQVSRSFPEATFRLLSGIRTEDTAIELGEALTDVPQEVARATSSHRSVLQYERLVVSDDRILSKYTTTDVDLYNFVEQASLPPEFPIIVRNGFYEFDLTGTRMEFDRFRAALVDSEQAYELLSIAGTDRERGLLTDRQRELLEIAVQQGYFEVPRNCTLATLAEGIGIDKSTASEVLRRGEARLLKWFLTGSNRERID